MEPLVTVYIPTKNRCSLLKRAIDSVKRQSYSNIQLVVVDDGSSDCTKEMLNEMSVNGELITIFNEKSMGACVARNKAIHKSSGKFITGLDDDDYFGSKDRIKDFVDKWYEYKGKCAGIFDGWDKSKRQIMKMRVDDGLICYEDLCMRNYIGNQVFAPKSYYCGVGGFDDKMPLWQDWDLWLRMSKKYGCFVGLESKTYIVGNNQDCDRISNKPEEDVRRAMKNMFEKNIGMNLKQKSSVISALYAYDQVRPKFNEILLLLIKCRFKTVVMAINKIFILKNGAND